MNKSMLKAVLALDLIGCSILLVLSSLYVDTGERSFRQKLLQDGLAKSRAAEKSISDARARTFLATATQSSPSPQPSLDDPALQQLGGTNFVLDMALSRLSDETKTRRISAWLFYGALALLGLNTVFLLLHLAAQKQARSDTKEADKNA